MGRVTPRTQTLWLCATLAANEVLVVLNAFGGRWLWAAVNFVAVGLAVAALIIDRRTRRRRAALLARCRAELARGGQR